MSVDSDQSSVTSEDSPQEVNPQSSPPAPIQDAPKLEASATLKTRGVRPPRGSQAQVLHGAAKKAAHSNSRNDVHEYMRLRRNYV
jgi:hypothetical protein